MPASATIHRPRRFRSWATIAVAASPEWRDALLYRRIDLAVFTAAAGRLESFAPRSARTFLAVFPAAISALLYWADPQLAFSGGLSGIAVGALVLLALVQLKRNQHAQRWLWPAVLALVAGKIAVETLSGAPLVPDFVPGIKVSTLAHLGGVACALLAWPWARREANT